MTFDVFPLSHYVALLEAGTSFASQLWGDGEFMAASGRAVGRIMQNGEIVTEALAEQFCKALVSKHPGIIRGTDMHLLFPERYGGQDLDSVKAHAANVIECRRLVGKGAFPDCWADGTVWDVAVRLGNLGPLIRLLRDRSLLLVSNQQVANGLRGIITPAEWVEVPLAGATSRLPAIIDLFTGIAAARRSLSGWVILLCMGMGAIPLMHQFLTHRRFEGAAWLDLGSVFDVFAGLGGDRGWRAELYAQDASVRLELIARNLEGSGV